jgi:hypothetical protein
MTTQTCHPRRDARERVEGRGSFREDQLTRHGVDSLPLGLSPSAGNDTEVKASSAGRSARKTSDLHMPEMWFPIGCLRGSGNRMAERGENPSIRRLCPRQIEDWVKLLGETSSRCPEALDQGIELMRIEDGVRQNFIVLGNF